MTVVGGLLALAAFVTGQAAVERVRARRSLPRALGFAYTVYALFVAAAYALTQVVFAGRTITAY